MTAWAVGFAMVSAGNRVPPDYICSHTDSLKMVWPDADAISTQMVYCQPVRNCTDEKAIGKAMHHLAHSCCLESGVTATICRPGPLPASPILVD